MALFALFRALPLLWQAGVALAVVASIWGGYEIWKYAIYQDGRAAERTVIDNQNRKANDAARRGISNVDQCYDRGGTWDATRGVCE